MLTNEMIIKSIVIKMAAVASEEWKVAREDISEELDVNEEFIDEMLHDHMPEIVSAACDVLRDDLKTQGFSYSEYASGLL